MTTPRAALDALDARERRRRANARRLATLADARRRARARSTTVVVCGDERRLGELLGFGRGGLFS